MQGLASVVWLIQEDQTVDGFFPTPAGGSVVLEFSSSGQPKVERIVNMF